LVERIEIGRRSKEKKKGHHRAVSLLVDWQAGPESPAANLSRDRGP
jgi:hypothetical protein